MVLKKKPAVKAKAGCKRKPVRSDDVYTKKPNGEYRYAAVSCHKCGGLIDLDSLYYGGKDRQTYCQGCASEVIAKERKGEKHPKEICALCGKNRPWGTGWGNICAKCAKTRQTRSRGRSSGGPAKRK